jgi:hypothetical protein
MLELLIQKWVQYGLDLYRATPRATELVFFDASQHGMPTGVANELLMDDTQYWLPDYFTGGILRYGGATFPITGNMRTQVFVAGDPSLVVAVEDLGYQIVPPAALGLQQLLETQVVKVLTSFAQVPPDLPSITIRLESDTQRQAYFGEEVEKWTIDGTEYRFNQTDMAGSYTLGIWTVNRESCLWLYHWLLNWATASARQPLAFWGQYDVIFGGSDLDPSMAFVPENVYTRHFLLTLTRPVRAVTVTQLEEIVDWSVLVDAQYQQFHATLLP